MFNIIPNAAANGRATSTTISGDELLRLNIPETRWAIPGLLPEGLSLLAGKPKTGKSWFMLFIAATVAIGGPALGQSNIDAGDVLYLGLEDTRGRLKKRLLKIKNGWPKGQSLSRLDLDHTWPLCGDGGLQKIEEWLKHHPNRRLIVIDTLARFHMGRKRGRDAYQDDYAAIAPLKAIADNHSVAIVVITHARKAEATDVFDTVTGTLGVTGAADSIMILSRPRQGSECVLSLTGRDVEERELALRFDADSAQWTLLGEAAEHRMSQERREVIELLSRSKEPMTPQQVSALMNKSKPATKSILNRMAYDGQISSKDGFYSTLASNQSNPASAATRATQQPEQPSINGSSGNPCNARSSSNR